jgi:hypothetical protein
VWCFGLGWDLVSAVAARFVGRGKFGNGCCNGCNGWKSEEGSSATDSLDGCNGCNGCKGFSRMEVGRRKNGQQGKKRRIMTKVFIQLTVDLGQLTWDS